MCSRRPRASSNRATSCCGALTGEVRTDETHANSTVFFDLRERRWAEDLLATFSLSADVFPEVVAPWQVAGAVSAEVAAATGAPPGCPVVIGAADSQCAAYGSGVNDPGPISEMAGASSCLNSIVPEPLGDPVVTHYSHVLPDRFCTELGVNTTGAAVQWALSRLAFEDYATLESAAAHLHTALREGAHADPIAAAPLFLPYLGDGERNDVCASRRVHRGRRPPWARRARLRGAGGSRLLGRLGDRGAHLGRVRRLTNCGSPAG